MSYQVIARKYRPQRFSDVVGQEHVTQTLANAIAQNRIAHAYLFCGPRGTGKTTIARIFAKCLNCTGGPRIDFDDDDPRCQEITEGRSIDVLEIDGASNNGVEQVRELRETVKYAPATSKFKIFIIDEVHMLSTAAFNALLKTLEEPPAHVKFMFATTDPEKVLPTILSRCQRYDLRRIPVSIISQQLAAIARNEKVEIDAEAIFAIARGADGGMRDAESALDQLISFCGDRIVERDVLSMFGLTAQKQILALAGAVLRGEAEVVLRELNDLAKHGKDLGRLLSDLLHHFRNLLIHQVSGGDLKLLEVSETEVAALVEQSPLAGTEVLTRIMEVLTDAEGRLRHVASKKIFMEVALLKSIQARNAVSIDAVLTQLQQMRGAGENAAAAPAPRNPAPGANAPTLSGNSLPPPGPVRAAPASASAPAAQKSAHPTEATPTAPVSVSTSAVVPGAPLNAEVDLDSLWRNLLEAVGRASAFTRSYLVEAFPVSLVHNLFTIGFDPEFADQLDLVNNQKTHSLLQTKLHELGLANIQVKFIKTDRPVPRSAPTLPEAVPAVTTPLAPAKAPTSSQAALGSTQSKKETVVSATINSTEFKNDPLIRQALEVFKGTIVEVRA